MYKALFSCQRNITTSFSCSCSVSVHLIWLSLDCILVDFMQKINIFKNRAAESESLEQRAVTLFKFNKMLEDCVHIDSPEKKKNDYSKSFYWMITNPQIKCWIQLCILKKKGMDAILLDLQYFIEDANYLSFSLYAAHMIQLSRTEEDSKN